jgi:hypothetical protein
MDGNLQKYFFYSYFLQRCQKQIKKYFWSFTNRRFHRHPYYFGHYAKNKYEWTVTF